MHLDGFFFSVGASSFVTFTTLWDRECLMLAIILPASPASETCYVIAN